MALTPVPSGHLATVVTSLEMVARPLARPMAECDLNLVRWTRPSAAKYRVLFQRVGAPWLWYSRLAMADPALLAIVHDPAVEVYAAIDRGGIEVGMLELNFRRPGECELSYLALVPEMTGHGRGRWLMGHALARGWRPGVARMWVNTCTLDHPSALGFYQASGFNACARTIETFPDPRLSNVLPRDAAPQVPILPVSRR